MDRGRDQLIAPAMNPMTDLDASSLGPFAHLDTMRWMLATYLRRGDRAHPLAWRSAAASERAVDDRVTPPLRSLLQSADRLARRVQHTDAVVTAWLVAHRVDVHSSEDPLRVLVDHVHDVLSAVATSGDDDAVLDHLQAQLTLPLLVVQQEVAAAAAHRAATVELVRTFRRDRRTVDESETYAS